MAFAPVGDASLVDVYANLGDADPLVIATARDGLRSNDSTLSPLTWTMVSDDKAVQAKAREFELEVTTNQKFLTLMEAETTSTGH